MRIDYLIIGQGICGTFLSYYLLQEGKTVLVIDDARPTSPSRIAAGVINPVTGRRLVTVWMVDEILPYAWEAYQQIGKELGIEAISQKNIIDFFPNPFMREGFLQKIGTGDKYVHDFPESSIFREFFNYEFGCGEISPVYTAHLDALLPAFRKKLVTDGLLLEKQFDIAQLEVKEHGISYENIEADKIIFCDGTSSFENPYFNLLPFAPNKGEALVAEIRELPSEYIFKKSMMLVPLAEKDHFWIGASYDWNFTSADASIEFRTKTEQVLKEWLKVPFKIVEHRSGLRPATLERRPFVGTHPLHPQIAILNGMGTKGCSLAPFFAKQLTSNLIHGLPIAKDADVARFTKILSRKK